MSRKRINVTVDNQLNERWERVAKRIGMTKSAMLDDMLESVLPILEADAKSMVAKAMNEIGQTMKELGNYVEESSKSK